MSKTNLPDNDSASTTALETVSAENATSKSTSITPQFAVQRLKTQFGDAIGEIKAALGEVSVYVKRERILDICRFLKEDSKLLFSMLADLTSVDLGIEADPRFEVIYHLHSLPNRIRLRLKVKVSEDDCHLATISTIWRTANWHEREVFDLMGIRFDGHPDMRKILTPDDLEGHPLRKDFPLRGY